MTANWTKKTPAVVALICVVVLWCGDAANGQTAAPRAQAKQLNTWSATSTTGLMVGGTWAVMPLADTTAVTGTWTLVGTGGRIIFGHLAGEHESSPRRAVRGHFRQRGERRRQRDMARRRSLGSMVYPRWNVR